MTNLVERFVPDELWVLFRRVVPPAEVKRPRGGGRRRAGDREVLAAVIFVATAGRTGRQLPPVFAPAWQTVYRRFAQWSADRVWARRGPRRRRPARLHGDRGYDYDHLPRWRHLDLPPPPDA